MAAASADLGQQAKQQRVPFDKRNVLSCCSRRIPPHPDQCAMSVSRHAAFYRTAFYHIPLISAFRLLPNTAFAPRLSLGLHPRLAALQPHTGSQWVVLHREFCRYLLDPQGGGGW